MQDTCHVTPVKGLFVPNELKTHRLRTTILRCLPQNNVLIAYLSGSLWQVGQWAKPLVTKSDDLSLIPEEEGAHWSPHTVWHAFLGCFLCNDEAP